ncbi:hypothetical protein [Candidatus Methanodesulfokora washburnensis]|uniref:SMODS-associated and fused to various effectors domain-containing protein n=1 Tax=Candidatus Methanodesulfokora washburnensis TaxID=2478471 RepID=A0A3R9QYZ2_9CREN|nr:hypothetical protein [Candidatus Methanodesulfokores washburnensis]RSN75432.1 hypothetical protein D6D85_06200 [Candidatus Methanodesulfokores washburnensis]
MEDMKESWGRKVSPVFVLEVGRPIVSSAASQLGESEKDLTVLSVPRTITETEIPKIAAKAYKMIMELGRGGETVTVILSGPLALAFELGQAIGLSHVNIVLYQFTSGKYFKVPPLTREDLFR